MIVPGLSARYERNFPALSEEEQARLAASSALIAGCGGLGGYIAEFLARAGVGRLTVADGDVFEVTNLNRQLLAVEGNIGARKADECLRRIESVNSGVTARAIAARIDEDNAREIARGHCVVLDALDSPEARLVLEDACAEEGVTIVHGAIEGWRLQVSVARPGRGLLRSLYSGAAGAEFSKTSLSFTPPLCAAIQASEAIKLLAGREPSLDGRLLIGDLSRAEFDVIELA